MTISNPNPLDNSPVLEYTKWFYESNQPPLWMTMTWRGVPIWKNPSDMWVYQELIYDIKPKRIIEFGTKFGGSALFFADMLDVLSISDGKVLSVDNLTLSQQFPKHWIYKPGLGVEERPEKGENGYLEMTLPVHNKLKYIVGDSISPNTKNVCEEFCDQNPVLIIEDSCHTYSHVYTELNLYHNLVSSGSYFIVEDTKIGDVNKAVEKFIRDNSDFYVDKTAERFGHTAVHSGFLRRR